MHPHLQNIVLNLIYRTQQQYLVLHLASMVCGYITQLPKTHQAILQEYMFTTIIHMGKTAESVQWPMAQVMQVQIVWR